MVDYGYPWLTMVFSLSFLTNRTIANHINQPWLKNNHGQPRSTMVITPWSTMVISPWSTMVHQANSTMVNHGCITMFLAMVIHGQPWL